MIILSATGITKAYGINTILSDISFHVNQGDKIGIVGDNGAGKTTLLSILSGTLSHDAGDFFISQDTTIGILKQRDNFSSDKTVREEMLGIFSETIEIERRLSELSEDISVRSAAGENVDALLHLHDDLTQEFDRKHGYTYQSEIKGILSVMAFSEDYFDKPASALSGGESTRLALASLLLRKPDLLLLDEPTNHLDIGTLKWLEQFIKSYTGTVILISHDRYFLDQTTTHIFEINDHRLTTYEGNYSTYREKKRQREEDAMRQYDQQKQEIERQEEMIRRFKQHGTEHLAKRAKSREHRLEHIERLERPNITNSKMKIHFREKYPSGTDVLLGEDLSKSFSSSTERKSRLLFRKVGFDIKRGERICMVGPNGIGKTTLLKIIMGLIPPDSGSIKLGQNVLFGYYDQEQKVLDDDQTVIEALHDTYRLYSETELRGLLGRFLFRNDDVFKQVGALSGGEKARLTLLKLMLTGANLLIMDEPTNHLDLSAKEVFEDALLEFSGTLLIVSHDRYLLNKVPTRIFELNENGIESFLGGYDYYVEKKQSIASGKTYLQELGKMTGGTASDSENESQAEAATLREKKLEERRKAKEQETRRRREEKDLAASETAIEELETKIRQLEKKMCDETIFSDHAILLSYSKELDDAKTDLASAYDRWLELQ